METSKIVLDRCKARELYHDYLTHRHYSAPIDEEIMRTYREIAKGRMVIQALESIRRAGLNTDGFPKLAIARADQKEQECVARSDGSVIMGPNVIWGRRRSSRCHFDWPEGAFVNTIRHRPRVIAIVPIIPLPLRPKRALQNYYVLWEADWSKIIPRDPMLLRRLGKGDLWMVLAQWELTEVERAALATRVNAA